MGKKLGMGNIEQTLIVIKPDGFKRRLTGRILCRFEDKGFELETLKVCQFTTEQAAQFYSPHSDKPFFKELVSVMTSGSVVASILQGEDAVNVVRLMIGSTVSTTAMPGTIRGDYGLGVTENIIHASDSVETFIKESKVIF